MSSLNEQRRTNYGSLVFCPTCGNLLDSPGDKDLIVCYACGDAQDATKFENISTISRSQDSAFPSALKNKRSLVQGVGSGTSLNARVEETCPKCGNNEMTFYTMQMRSADEGQTVFYKCLKCGYGFSVNN